MHYLVKFILFAKLLEFYVYSKLIFVDLKYLLEMIITKPMTTSFLQLTSTDENLSVFV